MKKLLNRKKNYIVVYESCDHIDRWLILRYLKNQIPVWIIEPFHTYHHRRGVRFFPQKYPQFIDELIEKGSIKILKADAIHARDISPFAADAAVKRIESCYPVYSEKYRALIDFLNNTVHSKEAERIFKKKLCDMLAEFYSVNMTIQNISNYFEGEEIIFYPDINVQFYNKLMSYVSQSGLEFCEHPNVRFAFSKRLRGSLEHVKQNLTIIIKLSAQTLASGFFTLFNGQKVREKKNYLYGISVNAPGRQLRGNRRGPDFIVDDKKIKRAEVVYLPIVSLTDNQKSILEKIGNVFYPPQIKRFFSNFIEWKKLLFIMIKHLFFYEGQIINEAAKCLFDFFRWKRVLTEIHVNHFVTVADFDTSHIGRNIAFNQAGIQTWYYTDSMNMGMNFAKKECDNTHPFWTYLYYDHYITWNTALMNYFKLHPQSFQNFHVVGCIWDSIVSEVGSARSKIKKVIPKIYRDNFIIAVYDTTYTINGLTSYKEGVAFADHIIQLADELMDCIFIFKEKKERKFHEILDPYNGHELINIYNKLDLHPRIISNLSDVDKMANSEIDLNNINNIETSELILVADMIISFPFTSTTFEAICANKPAIWHDPMGLYNDTPYGRVNGITTHNYKELKKKVIESKKNVNRKYISPIPKKSQLYDHFRDGKSIDRFRKLLISK